MYTFLYIQVYVYSIIILNYEATINIIRLRLPPHKLYQTDSWRLCPSPHQIPLLYSYQVFKKYFWELNVFNLYYARYTI